MSKKAEELAEKFGLKLERTDYIGSDQVIKTTPEAAISASVNFEQASGGNQGTTGGCGQDPGNVSSKK